MQTMSERLRWARVKRGLTCIALDAAAGLASGHTAMIESGRREDPSGSTCSKLAAALEVDVAWLLNGGARPQIAVSK